MRLLLCLSLVLNGSGYAVAAAKMQMEQSPVAATVRTSPQSERKPPCHEHADVAAGDRQGAAPEPASGDDVPDCCKWAKCAGACLYHAPAAIASLWIEPITSVHSDVVRPIKAAHAAPSLPRRIRPPIS